MIEGNVDASKQINAWLEDPTPSNFGLWDIPNVLKTLDKRLVDAWEHDRDQERQGLLELKAALLSHQGAVLSEKEADLLTQPLTETEAGLKCFQSLSQAVAFIAESLERNAALELMAQLSQISHPVNSDFFVDSLFPELQKHHHELDFRIRYPKMHFPPDEAQFKLGGHMKELGCIHIDFVKIEQGWILDTIWRCR